MKLTIEPKKDLLDKIEEFFGEVWKQLDTKSMIYITYSKDDGWGIAIPEQNWSKGKNGIGDFTSAGFMKVPDGVEIVGEIISTEAFK